MQTAQATRLTGCAWRQPSRGERGFAMAALLVAMAVLALMLSALLPVWHTLTVREKEAELLWRGQQYDRAIQLYRKKNAAPGPPNLDALIQGRFLRKKYKDPITNDDFVLVGVNAGAPGSLNTQAAPGMPGASGMSARLGMPGPGATQATQPPIGFGQLIGGVRSKSKARSFKELEGATTYDAWTFTYVPWKSPTQATPTGQMPGGGMPRMGAQPGGGSGAFGSGGMGSGGTGGRGPGQGHPPQQGRPPGGEQQPQGPGPGRDSQGQPVVVPSEPQ